MYRCTDCGQEFETKPEYCDCGNNVFVEITLTPPPPPKEPEQPKPAIREQPEPIPAPVTEELRPVKKTTVKGKKKSDISIFSLVFFVICIILSILSIIYIGKDSIAQMEQNKDKKDTKQTTVKASNIPSIDKLWKDGNPSRQQNIVKNQVAKVQPQSLEQPVPPVSQIQNTTAQNNVQTVLPKAQKTTVSQQPKTTISNAKQVQTTPAPITVKKQVQTSQSQTKQASSTTQAQANNNYGQQFYQYKTGLRKKLADKIDFGQVVGDGICTITFQMDSAGNLINRKFTVQSDNDTLNNVVFQAVKSTPTYQSPPVGYHGETLSFSVKMYGGRFSVTLY